MHTASGEMAFSCPRCHQATEAQFYGPCEWCARELRAAAAPTKPTPTVKSGTRTTRRFWHHQPKRSVWVAWGTDEPAEDDAGHTLRVPAGADLAELLEVVAGYRLVHLCGERAAELVRSAMAPPEGWRQAAAYTHDRTPATTVQRESDGAKVRLGVASAWCGEGQSPAEAAGAWRWVAGAVRDRFDGAVLLPTAGSTGRDLMARAWPHGVELPVLSDELAELIRTSSTQHRMSIELPGIEVPGFVELDMRLAYAAVVRGLPAGEPVRRRGELEDPYQPARCLASWTVPDGWAHPGVLPSLTDDGWRWPGDPGEQGHGWVDGAELHQARKWGWTVTVAESIVWPRKGLCDPLRVWVERLTAIYAEAPTSAARSMVRAMILHGLGALHGKGRQVTKSCPAAEADQRVPEGADWWTEGDHSEVVRWTEQADPMWPEWTRPEWTAAVWARTRCRLLDAPGGKAIGGAKARPVGALNLPGGVELIGFRGDALYLTGDPRWPDDGAPGRFRVKSTSGAMRVPGTLPELDRLRRQADDPAAIRAAIERARAAARGVAA